MEISSAIHSRSLDIFESILDSSDPLASIDDQNNTILHAIARKKDESIIEWVLQKLNRSQIEAGLKKRNISEWTPFHIATQTGLISTMEKFHQISPTELDATDSLGNTPLHFAIMVGEWIKRNS